MSADLAKLVGRLEVVTSRLEGLAASGGVASGGGAEVSSEHVEEFDNTVLNGKIKQFFSLSAKIGDAVAEQANLVDAGFKEVRAVLLLASKHKQPKPDALKIITKNLGDKVNAVSQFCDKRRAHKMFNHLMTVKEGIGCLGWVTVSPKPAPYVKETCDQALFYGNRVIKEYKGKDDTHVQWVRAYTGAILELQSYVKSYHTTGLVWNKEGTEATGAPPTAGGAPPPPPPPAVLPPTVAPAPSKGGDADADRANLFASINKGGDITKGLKKVTKDMQTHKNPELRATSVVKATNVKKGGGTAPKYGSAVQTKKPPVCSLEGKKWIVEYQEDNPNVTISDTNAKQAVYVFRCSKSTLKVTGKVNSIVLDNCKRMALCLEDVISSVEVINCQSVQVQVIGKCPTVSIDKTDGCQVFLSKDCLKCEIISAKSSEMNICMPKGDGDYSEHALPEQFKSTWDGKKFVTECSESSA